MLEVGCHSLLQGDLPNQGSNPGLLHCRQKNGIDDTICKTEIETQRKRPVDSKEERKGWDELREWDWHVYTIDCCCFSSAQSLSRVWLFANPWIAARQASLSITNSRSLLKFMPIDLTMPSNHLILCRPFSSCPQSLPASGSFPMSQLFTWGGQSIGVSASASVLPVTTQDWSPLGWTGWVSLQSQVLSRVLLFSP